MTAKQPSWRGDKRKTAERGYGGRWQRARKLYLQEHPLCVMCQAMRPPRVTAATVVDHIIPHQGDEGLFWNEGNWQSLCARHHNTDKAEQEGRHRERAKFGADGRVVW